ncbi:DUF6934 family protein [Dyadobacter psychrophilus]|uniref:Uncharacterized protein n=1 Tax=Dyadobacter psychrophilus TaxID=651661 RepID=A0A1T5C870_9BACT|nr:hypothetical protein [Dyadobacter psychrophilus]SKB55615.1 hypothetical protein SAMN05660293_00986 [Dyadobacter psychrophilus]
MFEDKFTHYSDLMDIKPYPFSVFNAEFRYEFVSISATKAVQKVVLFVGTGASGTYNLALLDVLQDGSLCDVVETRNGDFRKVLATVFQIIHHFFERNPDCVVMFLGSDERRHRMYRIVINREIHQISKLFIVSGVIGDFSEYFQPNTDYDYYLIEKL